ncbi:MAG TPA: hypothetical protein VKG25_00715 [Bryobacteraceae bacterium]|nr:hypothetical protein [Bryobacteraceae bacterium]
MRSSNLFAFLVSAASVVGAISLSGAILPKIDLPKDSPVVVIGADYDGSTETPRGGAVMVDLHAALSLRNSSGRHIRGITLLVHSQEATPGGKGSVTLTSLDIAPGETFPVHMDVRLLRPVTSLGGPLQLGLDGVLFDDLSFYGPDSLQSRHTLTAYEFEARRDRRYFKALLTDGGPERLKQEILASLARQTDRPDMEVRMGVQLARGSRATNLEPERPVQFALLHFPDSPIEPTEGMAKVAGNEARAPLLEVRNKSDRAVRYLEIGWLLKDGKGRQFMAGTVPATLNVAPGEKAQVLKETTLKFPQLGSGPASSIDSMTAFVNNVEFADGKMWVPSRADLSDPRLQSVLAPSPEEQRLVQLYRKKGLNALIDELKKF